MTIGGVDGKPNARYRFAMGITSPPAAVAEGGGAVVEAGGRLVLGAFRILSGQRGSIGRTARFLDRRNVYRR